MTTPKNPTAAEALGAPVPFTHDGIDYLVVNSAEWPYEALEAFEDGKIATFLRSVLGDQEHAKFKATKPLLADVNRFVEALQGALGISGN